MTFVRRLRGSGVLGIGVRVTGVRSEVVIHCHKQARLVKIRPEWVAVKRSLDQ